jgi:phosphoribosyl 1,2-cyclic phosphate phosphodiesterase
MLRASPVETDLMQILFLGTAAAEGIPAPFCECPVCTHAREDGGPNVRMRTATLANDDLLFDCGPDLVPATQRFGVSLDRLQTLLVTHAHFDHLLIDNLNLRRPDLRRDSPIAPLHVYGPGPVTRQIRRGSRWPSLAAQGHVSVETVRAGHRWRSGQYQITALPANHDQGRAALLYIVSDGQHKLVYATDSGPLPPRARRIIAQEAPFDAVLMDETMGIGRSYTHHNSAESLLEAQQWFKQRGLLTHGAHFVAFHFSHNGNPPHEDLVRHFARYGVTVAYDGMRLNL